MTDTFEIELGERLYELEIKRFQPEGPYVWNQPPETGEIELGNAVLCTDGAAKFSMTLDDFISDYIWFNPGESARSALAKVERLAYEEMMQRLIDAHEERDLDKDDG